MSDVIHPNFGYAFLDEKRSVLEHHGAEPDLLMAAFKDSFPKNNPEANPLGAIDILNQANQGACQGHSLALIFSICFFLATGRRQAFSRAAGYYLSQRYDGIRGDNGSTLSGGQKVATIHGMCLESDWPYPSHYSPTEPANVPYLFKLNQTRPFRTLAEVRAWNDLGLPIQTGMLWNSTCEKEVVDNWQPLRNSGGHSTTFWQRNPASGNIRMPNSWKFDWLEDGMNEWTDNSIVRMLDDKFTVLIGYGPDKMSFPDQDPLGV